MSKRGLRSWSTVVAGVLLAVLSGPSTSEAALRVPHGQAVTTPLLDSTVIEARARHQARLDRLFGRRQLVQSMQRAVYDSLNAVGMSDTVRAGFIWLVTTPELRVRATTAALVASRTVEQMLDQPALDVMRGTLLEVRAIPWRIPHLSGLAPLTVRAVRSDRWCCNEAGSGLHFRDPLTNQIIELAAQEVAITMPDGVFDWLMRATLPLLPPSQAELRRAQMQLGTANSHVAERCLHGGDDACAALLDLRGRPRDPASSWYAAEDYVRLVARLQLAPTDGRDAPQLQADCLMGRAASCAALLRMLAPARIPPPVTEEPRLVLVQEALRLGGSGAFARLRHSTGDIGTRLAAASGGDEARLLAQWRMRLKESASDSAYPTVPTALATCGWSLLLAAAGMRRVRRCR